MKDRALPLRIILGAGERVADALLVILAIIGLIVGAVLDIGHGLRRRGRAY